MKTIIAGDRSFDDPGLFRIAMEMVPKEMPITSVVCGMAKGADTLGAEWACEKGLYIHKYPANWALYHKAAGPIRNAEMANFAEALIAFLAPGSKGTKNMIECAKKKNLPIFIVYIDKENMIDAIGDELTYWDITGWEYIGPKTGLDDGKITGKNNANN